MSLDLVPIQGPVTIGSRGADFHPGTWDPKIHQIRALGRSSPLTLLLDKLGDQKTESRHFRYQMEQFDGQNGAITDIYTDSALSSAYASGGVSGSAVFLKMSAANAKLFRAYDTVLISDLTDKLHRKADVVDDPVINGASSYVQAALLETDTSNALADASLHFTILPRSEREVSELPQSVFNESQWFSGYCQFMLEAGELSDAEIIELERAEPNIRERIRKQAFERLMKRREMGKIFGIKTTKGDRYFSQGIYDFLVEHNSGNILNYKSDTTYSATGATWRNGGMDFFRNVAEYRGRYSGNTDIVVLAGGLALAAIDELVYAHSHYHMKGGETTFGFRIKQLELGREMWNLVEHPLFSTNPAFRSSMLIVEPAMLKVMTFMPLEFIPFGKGSQDGHQWLSAEKCGWKVNEGLKLLNPYVHMWLDNVGEDK